jgi:hypothetical protein
MVDHVQNPETSDASKAPYKRKVAASNVVASAISIWVAFLIAMILLKGSDLGSPESAQSALIAANERSLQMVQWTIATVLTLGGALIGLNWYQGEKRYEHDRQVFEEKLTAEMDRKLSEYNANLDMLTRASILSLDSHAARMIEQSVGARDGSVNDLTYVDRVIRAFQTANATLARRGVAQVLIGELIRAAHPTRGKPGNLEQDQLNRMENIAGELNQDAPDKAKELEVALQAYTSWHEVVDGEAYFGDIPAN